MAQITPAVLFSWCLIGISGCTTHRIYDLKNVEPFSAYAGNEVTLTVPCVLLEYGPSNVYLASQVDWEADESAQRRAHRLAWVPQGAKILVERSLFFRTQSVQWTHEKILSRVIMEPGVEGWPEHVSAYFNHAGHRQIEILRFKGTIIPAPWEPPPTPAARSFRLPSSTPTTRPWWGNGRGRS